MSASNITSLFFDLVKVSLGHLSELSATPTPAQWEALFAQARRQTLIGVLYAGVERLPAAQRPPRQLLLQWFAITERIRSMNRMMNARSVEAHRFFLNEGFRNVIFKGQSVARLYPDPLLRTPGDIDVWLEGGRERILQWAAARGPVSGLTYCHLHYPLFKDTEVEAHFIPSWMCSPIAHRRLQRWFRQMAPSQYANEVELPRCEGTIAAPTAGFDRVFILLHIYRHLFGEGIGLRQLLDYYYVLRQGCTPEEREQASRQLAALGMTRFSRAVSWIMTQVFALEPEHLIDRPDEADGKFVLREVMISGNFGKYDPRFDRTNYDKLIPRVAASLRRNVRFLRSYPAEILCDPFFRTAAYLRTHLRR